MSEALYLALKIPREEITPRQYLEQAEEVLDRLRKELDGIEEPLY